MIAPAKTDTVLWISTSRSRMWTSSCARTPSSSAGVATPSRPRLIAIAEPRGAEKEDRKQPVIAGEQRHDSQYRRETEEQGPRLEHVADAQQPAAHRARTLRSRRLQRGRA